MHGSPQIESASDGQVRSHDTASLDVQQSRDWYVKNLGFKVEFERGGITAIQYSGGFTIFLRKATSALTGDKVTLSRMIGALLAESIRESILSKIERFAPRSGHDDQSRQ